MLSVIVWSGPASADPVDDAERLLEDREPLKSITIGRAPDNDIIFDHPKVSRYQARVTIGDGPLQIEDLGTTNGVFINGTQVARCAFRIDDSITFGKVPFDTDRLRVFLNATAGGNQSDAPAALQSDPELSHDGHSGNPSWARPLAIGIVVVALTAICFVVVSRFDSNGPSAATAMVAGGGVTNNRGELDVPSIGTLVTQNTDGQPLADIDVVVLGSPDAWMSVYTDPQGVYLPAFNNGPWANVDGEEHAARSTGWTLIPRAYAQASPEDRSRIVTVLQRVSQWFRGTSRDDLSGPVDALAQYIEDPPEVLLYRDNYEWICMTEDQLVDEYRVVRELVLLPFRLAGGQLIGAIDDARNRLAYFGVTDEGVVRLIIHRLYGALDRYLVGRPTFTTIFDMENDSDEIIQYSALRYLDPVRQNELPVWAVLGECDVSGEPSPLEAELSSPAIPSGAAVLEGLCRSICSDLGCAADLFDDYPRWRSDCEPVCRTALAGCSVIWANMQYCRDNYACDGNRTWNRCLDERIPDSAYGCVTEPPSEPRTARQPANTVTVCDLFRSAIADRLFGLRYRSNVPQIRGAQVSLVDRIYVGDERWPNLVSCSSGDDDAAVNGTILANGEYVTTFVAIWNQRQRSLEFSWIAPGTTDEGVFRVTETSSAQGNLRRGALIELAQQLSESRFSSAELGR